MLAPVAHPVSASGCAACYLGGRRRWGPASVVVVVETILRVTCLRGLDLCEAGGPFAQGHLSSVVRQREAVGEETSAARLD